MKRLKRILLGVTSLCMLFAFACGDKKESASSESVADNSSVAESVTSEQESVAEETSDASEEPEVSEEPEASEEPEVSEEPETSEEPEVHEHDLSQTEEKAADCTTDGNIAYYTCVGCGKYYADEDATVELSEEELVIPASHTLTYHEGVAPVGKTNGSREYWTCTGGCEGYFADEEGETAITLEDTVIVAAMNIPDFLVEVEEGRDPVVLQLSDTQIWSWGATPEEQCYRYVREVVEKTNPDLIILTGDVMYGKFDPEGKLLTGLITFMETLKTHWAPVFGNHDNESLMGVDWQCQQFEEAEYCLFKQGDVTGNGNYSVGLAQGDELLRVFYMMDSNGCGSPMIDSNGKPTAPAPGTNVVKTSQGFGQDQIDWYTEEINAIHAVDADVKISMAYHIQQAVFLKAFQQYEEYDGLTTNSALTNPLNLDTMETARETDFGYVGRPMKGGWDNNYAIFNGMKALGVDSIFVGHEHCNSSSIVYEGVRLQYGQKSSTYDRYNSVTEDGTIIGASETPAGAHPIVGGTVIPVSSTDGTIGKGYLCYYGDPFYFEPKPVEMPVNGMKLDTSMLQAGAGMTIQGMAFSETLNAYKIYSEGQGKLYFDTALAAEYNTFTFTAFIPEDSANTNPVEFYLRVKPTNNLEGCTDGKYVNYTSSQIPRGEWKTFAVDISGIDETCTEFSLMFAALSTTWLRDVDFTNDTIPDEGGDTPEEIVVNGLQFGTDLTVQTADTVTAVKLADGTTAYEYVATSSWNKLYICKDGAINGNALKGKTTVSFEIMLPENTTESAFAIRIKPNPTEEQVPNINNGYLYFDEGYTGDRNVVTGEWKTVTVDISAFADACTEFSIYLFAGTTAYVRNITVS